MALATWNGRISPVFDVTRQIQILDIDNGSVVTRREESLPGTDPLVQVERLAELGPQVLICGAISNPLANMLTARNIRVLAFTAGDIDQVIDAWLKGTLPNPALSMPGCCGRRRGCNNERGRWRNGQGCTKGRENPLVKT